MMFQFGKSEHVSVEHAGFAMISRIYRDWTASIRPDAGIERVTLDAVDFRGKPSAENVLFVRMKVRTKGKPFDQVVQLRGNSVGMLVILIVDDKRYTVLTQQTRLPTGGMLCELPAGMVDSGTFVGAAAKEIAEEVGFVFREQDLIPLSREPIYLTPGLLDEAMQFFAIEHHLTQAELDDIVGRVTGVAEEGEVITLKVVPLDHTMHHAHAGRDAKAHIALMLYGLHLHRAG
ncbi:MAG: NUDIX domain-containing protein [Patescibacteria group bacterium]